jgi:hypothetical protein
VQIKKAIAIIATSTYIQKIAHLIFISLYGFDVNHGTHLQNYKT